MFSADSATLALASHEWTVQLSDGKMGDHIVTLHGHFGGGCIAFSADGSRLILGSFNIGVMDVIPYTFDKAVLIWDITDTTRPRLLFKGTGVDVSYARACNSVFLLETRREPTLCGLTVLNLDSPSTKHTICWFPTNVSPRHLVVHPAGLTAAVLCDDGHLLFLDLSKVPIS